ncbi:hypothetical protein MACJ_003864 [Theileria orientalis]|uniref:ABC transporter n=1 Tax=Theileria orientalis TaxID=68886 RepID=A0A976SKI3_THEOR|nr:hypothetical protein MACJ_003864 [Theileria orientalis]
MNQTKEDKGDDPEKDTTHCFWESELYSKKYFRDRKNSRFNYYDNATVVKYLFHHWVTKWVYGIGKEYLEPHKYHPLPVSDQILYWQPIFSKHISDGIARIERCNGTKSSASDTKAKKQCRSILLPAMVLTFWKRFLVLGMGLVVTNVLSMSISILVKKLLELLNDKSIHIVNTILLLLVVIIFQILDGLFIENINFYVLRLICIIHYLISISIFEHGLSHRRRFSNNINGCNSLNVCNQVLHSCSPDSECLKNPLFCQALRYQSKEVSPQIFTFEFVDCHHISLMFQSIKFFIEFISNFIYGIFLISLQVKGNLLLLYVVGFSFLAFMISAEIFSIYTLKYILYLRDYKIGKYNDIIPSLPLIKKMFCDDIGLNIITQSRNNELSLLVVIMFLTFFNLTLFITSINISFYVIKRYFVESVNAASVITDIDTAGFMTTFYIFLRIITSMFLVPTAIKVFGMSYVSFKRMDNYFKTCSPNFYIAGNPYTGSTKTSTVIAETTNQIPNDTVVYYKDATFTWVHTRDDLLDKNYEPYLKNINFELKRGQVAIVTGSKGSGKSNFIKSILGEMTLVGGSMAVVPLYTSMPIFYASEDIFLQHGTVRSNITFGYRFDEHIYNTVLKAVELEYDLSTWDKGDLRILSDNALSLSGGQRVRLEMARAVYAYLVFHKVNEEYNNSKCSFLMCLDSPFHGLDPFVSKTVFTNLFNIKTGTLIKEDISVVISSTKQTLEICSMTSDLKEFPNRPIYKIKNQTLKFYSNLHDFVKKNKVNNEGYKYLSAVTSGPYHMNYLKSDMLSLCSSGCNTRLGRKEVTKSIYKTSFKTYVKEEIKGVKINRYKILMSPALATFIILILLLVVLTVMDNLKLVLATNLSDYITKNINQFNEGKFVDLAHVKKRSNFSLKITTMFVSLIIILSVLSTVFMTTSFITSFRKIHEYVLNSIFKNSSSVIKIKKDISQIITYLASDIMLMDDILGLFFSLSLLYLLQTVIIMITLFYLIPISIPLVIISLIILYKFILIRLINSSKNAEFAYLETMSQCNFVCENAISGPSIYRGFKRNMDLKMNFIEHSDYYIRCIFICRSVLIWASIVFNWIFSATTFVVLVLPIILDRFTNYNLKVGYFGLGLSLLTNVLKFFTKFASNYTYLEICMCSLQRFKYFVPPGEKVKFSKFLNTYEESLVNPVNKEVGGLDKNQLLKRRAIEFRADNKRFYALRRLFYHPRITIMDADDYLTSDHTGVQLIDVCVHTTPDLNPESMILKHLTVSAGKSEIIGMVGRTGAGKTTLLSVLQNISTNRTGQVLLDGRDMNDIPKVVLRQIIGVLPQLPFVFKGWTVRRFIDPRKLFSDDDINDALDKCGLFNFVNELQGGKKLDTVLVKENLGLSRRRPKPVDQPKVNESDRIGTSSELGSFDGHGKYGGTSKHRYESDTLLSNTQLRTLSLARLSMNLQRKTWLKRPVPEVMISEFQFTIF